MKYWHSQFPSSLLHATHPRENCFSPPTKNTNEKLLLMQFFRVSSISHPHSHQPTNDVINWPVMRCQQGQETPIYIWYENYPTHSGEGYEGRVSKVPADSPFGAASLNLTNIRESDQGWYECKVVFLNRSPNQHKNGTWYHLDVHAPPRFSVTPEDIIYVNLGEWKIEMEALVRYCRLPCSPVLTWH